MATQPPAGPEAGGEAALIAGWLVAYPARLCCVVAGETVRPQAGGYDGGPITSESVGPFKGEPGTSIGDGSPRCRQDTAGA